MSNATFLKSLKKQLGVLAMLLLLTATLLSGCGESVTTTPSSTSPDTVPNAFIFVDQMDVALSTVIESAAIIITGIDSVSTISISGGEYSIDSGAFTNVPGTISNGQTVKVNHLSSASNATTFNTTLTIGGVSDIFSTTTVAGPDATPDAFSFVDQTDVALSTLTESAAITVSGITVTSDISVSGGEYSLDGGAYTSVTGTVTNGQLVTVRHTSSATNHTTVDTTLTIGGVSDTFTSTTVVAAGLYDVVDTAQIECANSSTGAIIACSGIGYDADYSGNQPSYTLTDGGLTVTDNVTGLIWMQSTDTDGVGIVDIDDKMTQSEAVTYCANLTTAGYTWRLPNIKEAYSLIMFTGEDPSSYMGTDTSGLITFVDETYFDRVFGDQTGGERLIDGQFATTTIYLSTTMGGNNTMFGVNFVDGRIKGYPTVNKDFFVRCVTGNESYGENLFTDNGDGTISDTATTLMWMQDDIASSNWDDAVSICENATTPVWNDWRLPNAKELQSIVDYTRSPDTHSSAAIDPIFNSTSFTNEEGFTDWGFYWASTTHQNNAGNSNNATYLSFGRALGYYDTDPTPGVSLDMDDVHGAGAQRSNDKLNVSTEPGAASANIGYGTFYYHGPQGDILRLNNKVRCVR